MISVILTIHILIAFALIVLVLLQRSEGGGLGIGGGGNMMANRSASNPMTRATAGLVALFFITSLLMTILARPANNSDPLLLPATTNEENSGESSLPVLPTLPESTQ